MKSKRQVIAEGQRKGLERALEALNEAIIAESKKKKKQKKKAINKAPIPPAPIPTIYPDAQIRPNAPVREIRNQSLVSLFPDNVVFFLGVFPELEKYGVKGGEVYIDGKVLRKLIAGKLRINSKNALSKIRNLLGKIFHVWKEPNHQTGEASLYAYSTLDGETIWKIVISLEGTNANKITTVFQPQGEELDYAKSLIGR